MIIYEITAKVGENLIENSERYMRRQHIPDLMEAVNFTAAEMAEIRQGSIEFVMRLKIVKCSMIILKQVQKICAKIL